MHGETLLRSEFHKRTENKLSALIAKQLQWTTTVCKNCKKGETLAQTGGFRLTPAEWEKY